MKSPKRNSKRQTLKLQFTIRKKIAATKSKMKKLSRTEGGIKKTRRKDPGIPNSFPLKSILLSEVQQTKERLRQEKLARRQRLREENAAIHELKKGQADDEAGAMGQLGEEVGKFSKTTSAMMRKKRAREEMLGEQEDFDFMEALAAGEGKLAGGEEEARDSDEDDDGEIGKGDDDAARRKEKQQKKKQKDELCTAAGSKKVAKAWQDGAMTMDDLAAAAVGLQNAAAAALMGDDAVGADAGTGHATTLKERRAFMKELKKVVQLSDVVLHVLDARDPNGCRSPQAERYVLAEGKRLVFVLNKIDLVPQEVVKGWLVYLRRLAPTIAFKALTTTSTSGRTAHSKNDPLRVKKVQLESSSQVFGASSLLELLKNFSRVSKSSENASEASSKQKETSAMADDEDGEENQNSSKIGNNKKLKTAIAVGVIGYPNVGKSSIINSMKRNASAVAVGGEAGVTRHLQEVQLDKNVKLIDSPGVVFSGGEANDPVNILRNAVKVSAVEDPESVVEAIVARCQPEVLMRLFNVPAFPSAKIFIAHVARARGRLLKGGRPDVDAAARSILTAWTSGRIRHYCLPPSVAAEEQKQLALQGSSVDSAVVAELAPAFDIDSLWTANDTDLAMAASAAAADDSEMGSAVVVKAAAVTPSSKGGAPSSGGHVSLQKLDKAVLAPSQVVVEEADRSAEKKLSPSKQQKSANDDNEPIKKRRRRALLVEEQEVKEAKDEQKAAAAMTDIPSTSASKSAESGGRRRKSTIRSTMKDV